MSELRLLKGIDVLLCSVFNGILHYSRWRKVIYELVERAPSSLFLTFAMKMIADAGHAHEIGGKNTATQQVRRGGIKTFGKGTYCVSKTMPK